MAKGECRVRILGSSLYDISGESTEVGSHHFDSVIVWIIADLEIK
jgi:hypothetical protein